MSFAPFLCKAEAAALKTEDLDVPTDPITAEISLDSGFHRFMFGDAVKRGIRNNEITMPTHLTAHMRTSYLVQ